MIKYFTYSYEIQSEEIQKETEKFIFRNNGIREAKNTEWKNWHDSWLDAHDFLIKKQIKEISKTESRLQEHKNKLLKIQNLIP